VYRADIVERVRVCADKCAGCDGHVDERELDKIERAIGIQYPLLWRSVADMLLQIGPLLFSEELEYVETGEPSSRNLKEIRGYFLENSEYSDSAFVVAGAPGGDSLCLATKSPLMPNDCPVFYLNHETLEATYRWDSIADFLEDMLSYHEALP